MSKSLPPSRSGAAALLPSISENEIGNLGWLSWWYRLSVPRRPDDSASFARQDIYRRARLASILLFLLLVIMVAATLVSALTRNFSNMLLTVIVTLVLLLAVWLNRRGSLIIEGLLIVGLWTIGLVFSFIGQPQISIGTIIQYDLLTVAILLAVTFFPPWSVFIVALFNCIFIAISIPMLKYTPSLTQFLHDEGVGRVVTRPISLTIVIMVITYLWARSSQHALQRADRAETIAALQYDLAARDEVIAQQKMQMEHSIQMINDTLVSYANGQQTARVPLSQDNVLWNIAGPINNLLNRVQRMRHAEAELHRMRTLIQHASQLEYENAALRATLQRQGVAPTSLKNGENPMLQRPFGSPEQR